MREETIGKQRIICDEIALREVEKATKQQRMEFEPEKPSDLPLMEI
jgi:hypothetical protein